MAKSISNIQKYTGNEQFFSRMFGLLLELFKNNERQFSQMKALSHELASHLEAAGNAIHSIAHLYEEHLKCCAATFKKLHFNLDNEQLSVYRKLQAGLYEWGSQLITEKSFVVDHLASFFHFVKHENIEFAGLLQAKSQLVETIKERVRALDEKKHKLFEGKSVDRWKINFKELGIGPNEIDQPFEKIRPYMLPDETRPVNYLIQMNSFVNKHLLYEYLEYFVNSQSYIEENFADFSKKMRELAAKDDSLFNIFERRVVNFSATKFEASNPLMMGID